jgi:transcriptional regulator with XRE-family HTH domain
MYFSANLNYLLEKSRWTKADLAREINISPSQVKRYLEEGQQPKIELAVAIAKAFNVSLDDLVLIDLTKHKARPFGAEGEDVATTDETLVRMNELLEQRLRIVEQQLKKSDPGAAKVLGIK